MSLAGCPDVVNGDFICGDNDELFTEEDVREACEVRGNVINGI
jgi:hypothetical protein